MSKELAHIVRQAWTCGDELSPFLLQQDANWFSFWQVREHLIDRAISAATERGHSYRDFQVGAAVFLNCKYPHILRAQGRTVQHIYTGSNWKDGADERNTCAEQEIVSQIRQQPHIFDADRALVLVIAGNPLGEPDRESGLDPTVLHPCSHCRKLLQSQPQFTEDTIVASVNLDNTHREILLLGEILKMHKSCQT